MNLRVLYYRLSFRPGADYGNIRIYLENQSHFDFTRLSAQEFNALVNVLDNEPVFWNGTWLYTENELVQD